MTIYGFLPSRDLITLSRRGAAENPTCADIRRGLTCIARALGVEHGCFVRHPVTLRSSQEVSKNGREDDVEGLADQFETQYARQWLLQVTCLRWLDGKADEELNEEEVEKVVEEASRLTSIMAGQSASSDLSKEYAFDLHSEASRPISVRIRNAPLVEDSLGARTWAAAPLLAAYLIDALDHGAKRSNGLPASVLELGAGTGLSGLAVAAHLRRLRQSSVVHLTDYHPTVLANLSRNAALNEEESGPGDVSVETIPLDWRSAALSATVESPLDLRLLPTYDCLIAADCVYEASHASLLHAVATKFLSRTANDNAAAPPSLKGKLVLLSTLRTSHQQDLDAIRKVFPSNGGLASPSQRVALELRITSEIYIVADNEDDFGPPALRLSGDGREDVPIRASLLKALSSPPSRPLYNLCIIEWMIAGI